MFSASYIAVGDANAKPQAPRRGQSEPTGAPEPAPAEIEGSDISKEVFERVAIRDFGSVEQLKEILGVETMALWLNTHEGGLAGALIEARRLQLAETDDDEPDPETLEEASRMSREDEATV